jgi:hypothetical protein
MSTWNELSPHGVRLPHEETPVFRQALRCVHGEKVLPGLAWDFLLKNRYSMTAGRDRLSRSVKGIRVRVSVKSRSVKRVD